MRKTSIQNKNEKPLITVKVIYSKDGSGGLLDAYRLLARKMLEEKEKCKLQSMSE